MIDLNAAKSVAESAVKIVGKRISAALSEVKPPVLHKKGDIDYHTDMDVWSEKEISRQILENFPGSDILGEESWDAQRKSGAKSPERSLRDFTLAAPELWVIDPIDGTNNFSNFIPHFAVSVALMQNGVSQVGVVYDPMREELYSAVRGQGATLNGERIRPSDRAALNEAVVGVSFPVDRSGRWPYYWSAIEEVVLNCRSGRVLGSGALNLCWVACGRLDGIVEHNLKIWDVAAAALISEEAGCVQVNIDVGDEKHPFKPLDLFGTSYIVSGKNLFSELAHTVAKGRASRTCG